MSSLDRTASEARAPERGILSANEVHVWYTWTAICDTPGLRARYASLLDAPEHDRLARLTCDRVKLEYLVTRALCRCVLSRYLDVEPAHWRFVTNAQGKPEIDSGTGDPPLRFNLTNTRSLVACAVTHIVDVGIDIEPVVPTVDIEAVARCHFAREERRDLDALPPAQRPRRFLQFWTLKEAYLKAAGTGLSFEPERVVFSLADTLPDPAIGLKLDTDDGNATEDWQFFMRELEPSHLMAIAVRRNAQTPFSLRLHETVP